MTIQPNEKEFLNTMPYDAVFDCLERCRQAAAKNEVDQNSLIEALEQLVAVLEADLTQIKVALAHNARLLEQHSRET
jgi:hypothetical protein